MKLMNLPKYINSAWMVFLQGGWGETGGYLWFHVFSTCKGKCTVHSINPEPTAWLTQEWTARYGAAHLTSSFRNLLSVRRHVEWRNEVQWSMWKEWPPCCWEILLVGLSNGTSHVLSPKNGGKRCCRSSLDLGTWFPLFPAMSSLSMPLSHKEADLCHASSTEMLHTMMF